MTIIIIIILGLFFLHAFPGLTLLIIGVFAVVKFIRFFLRLSDDGIRYKQPRERRSRETGRKDREANKKATRRRGSFDVERYKSELYGLWQEAQRLAGVLAEDKKKLERLSGMGISTDGPEIERIRRSFSEIYDSSYLDYVERGLLYFRAWEHRNKLSPAKGIKKRILANLEAYKKEVELLRALTGEMRMQLMAAESQDAQGRYAEENRRREEENKRREQENKRYEEEKKRREQEENRRRAEEESRSNRARGDRIKDGLFAGCDNLTALKRRRNELLRKYHPDNLRYGSNADNSMAQRINEEYERAEARLKGSI